MPVAITGSRGLNETGSGLLTSYQGDALQGLGFPSLVGLIQTDQKAATTGLASAVLATVTQSGTYAIATGIQVYGVSGTNGTGQPLVIYQGDDQTAARIINATSAVSVSQTTVAALNLANGIVVVQASANTSIYGSSVLTGGGTPSYRMSMACFRLS